LLLISIKGIQTLSGFCVLCAFAFFAHADRCFDKVMHFIDLFMVPGFRRAFGEMHDELHAIRVHFARIDRWKRIGLVPVNDFSKLKARFLYDFIDIRDKIISAE
jgi:hypothetical protein